MLNAFTVYTFFVPCDAINIHLPINRQESYLTLDSIEQRFRGWVTKELFECNFRSLNISPILAVKVLCKLSKNKTTE